MVVILQIISKECLMSDFCDLRVHLAESNHIFIEHVLNDSGDPTRCIDCVLVVSAHDIEFSLHESISVYKYFEMAVRRDQYRSFVSTIADRYALIRQVKEMNPY